MTAAISGGATRGGVRMRLGVLVGVLLACAIGASSASAAIGHRLTSQITQAAGASLAEPSAIAINHATGEIFVVNGDAIDVFSAAGVYKASFGEGVIEGSFVRGVAVDKSTGLVYAADTAADVVDVFKPNGSGGYALLSQWTGAGTPAGKFGEAYAVAVNATTGSVYVTDLERGIVDIFKANPAGPEEAAEGKYAGTLIGGKLEEPSGLAVNEENGRIYAANGSIVNVYGASGKFEKIKAAGKSTPGKEAEFVAVAVEESTGDIYAGGEGAVYQFDPTGGYLGTLTTSPPPGTPFGEVAGVALSSAGGVYVADVAAVVVDVFGPGEVVPSVKSLPPSFAKITRTTATLKGTFAPEGSIGPVCRFEYETSEEVEQTGVYKNQAPCVLSGTTAEASITGLTAGVAYQYRIVGENAATAAEFGRPVEFSTDEAVSGLSTGPAEAVAPTSATLTGTLTPEAIPTKYHFEYGETPAYGSSAPVPDAESSEVGPIPAAAPVSGLRSNTVYHYRLVATNEFGTSFGQDASFKTSGPPAITSLPTTVIGHTTATIHAKVNPEELDTTYHFEYGTTTAYGTTVPVPDTDIGAGSTPVEVSAELTGLKLATTYHFRVVATNSAGTTTGPDQEFTTVLIEDVSATSVGGESATLQARLNPQGLDTKYHFEYGETEAYGVSIPVPEEDIGSGTADQVVKAELFGLHPGVLYHFRVVVSVQGLGTIASADHTFTTLTGAAPLTLPDGRAYELVSPPNKHGGFIEPINGAGGPVQAAADGNSLAYLVDGPIVEQLESNRSPEPQQVLATRGSASWANQEIPSPHSSAYGLRPGSPDEYLLFSPDLALSVVQPFPFGLTKLAEPPLSPPLSEAERGNQQKTIYVRNNAPIAPSPAETSVYNQAKASGEALAAEHGEPFSGSGYMPLVTAANTAPNTSFGGVAEAAGVFLHVVLFLGATPDLTHEVLGSEAIGLTSDSNGPGIYEASGGALSLVSILPDGSPATTAPSSANASAGELALGFGSAFGKVSPDRIHAISDDGSRIFWSYWKSAEGETQNDAKGHLFLRDMVKGETIQIDTPEAGITAPAFGSAKFQFANAEGTKVFFTDTQRLTADSGAKAGNAVEARRDLYECDIVEVAGKLSCHVKDLTPAPGVAKSAGVQGLVLGASDNGAYVYFVATGALATGGQSEADNLYQLHEAGGVWSTKFIGRLSSEDGPDWSVSTVTGVGGEFLSEHPARVSPEGHFLAFMSNRRLTGYNNTDVNEAGGEQHADEEVFLFSADSSTLTCVSCNPSGARPRGVDDLLFAGEGHGLLVDQAGTWNEERAGIDHWLAGSIPGWTPLDARFTALYQSRYLSDTGRLFFTSADALLPQAAGHTRSETIKGKEEHVGVENVYEYEPGSGVGLISSGTSNRESAFLDASLSGNDVFFLTAPALISQDVDVNFDVYDARVCTEASPCQVPPPPPAAGCTDTGSCRPGTSSPPGFVTPPSVVLGTPSKVVPGSSQVLPSKTTTKPKPKPLTRKQKLANALKKCRKLPKRTTAQKHKRAACEKTARKKFGTVHHSKKGKK
jgi:hypothetical protein